MNDTGKRRALGRGLDALIVGAAGDARPESTDAGIGGARMIPVADIQPNPRQPRTSFDDAALDELAASIREHGIILPLVLTADPQHPQRYWLVAGERRWRAAQRAGLHSAPAIIREANSQQLVELALIENVQRADLNPLEEAAAYQALIVEFGLTQAEVADRVGKSRSAVANAVRLLGLPQDVQRALTEGRVSAGHARALLALPDDAEILAALAEVVRRELNVRQTEALVKRMLAAVEKAPTSPIDPRLQVEVTHMEDRFRRALGTRVALTRNPDGSGRLVIHFYNDVDLESIYTHIAGPDVALDDAPTSAID